MNAPLTSVFAERVAGAHRFGLERVRRAVRFAVAHRDRKLPRLAQIRNLDYPAASGKRAARLYVPLHAAVVGPAVLFFHGGGFVISDIETHDALCQRLADAAGVRVLSAAYGLAPEHPFPSQIEDARAAFAWMLDQAADLGIDVDRLAVAGDSAGAYLAATVASEANARQTRAVKAQGLFYPLVHLDDEIWAQTLLRDARLIGRLAVAYINAQLADARAPSLLDAVGPATPPTFLVSGALLDPVHPDAVAYAKALEAAGVPVELKAYPGQAHGFVNFTHVLPVAVEAVAALGERLGKALRDGA
ncbi:alpha/beta hydrolase [Caulobacter sp. UNC279MFTsu5.1]|uniref:alpha/beta hydrolase n=1 Tax=Caulobacter sp. UNC279MFTsu5.1 TaxID=1502775 RepID=UPI0008E754EE|nr:alpha/beta hydrolase [Caulobacter sp. UNC279MFTsu5.1]SFJ78757.1 acetyl esterase [Caulobacter sp. UNC279MFTsu5.1]